MVDSTKQPGRLRPAPENFLTEEQVKAVGAGRRDFLRKSFLAAGAALAAPLAAMKLLRRKSRRPAPTALT